MRCFSETRSVICAVIHVVEPLKERHAVNEVEARASEGANVVDDKVDGVRPPTNLCVKLPKVGAVRCGLIENLML